MNAPVNPAGSNQAAAAGSCCGPTPTPPSVEAAPVRSAPCCGTGEGAEAAGACCDPQAKREAVATGAGCC
ncbi:hypothetical protein [Streptomyces yangpuensis]|uniref:hypothetical protein n=1 Tax=Streptomyces yangpuensis TaxID=1648182 RepID=UPI003653A588